MGRNAPLTFCTTKYIDLSKYLDIIKIATRHPNFKGDKRIGSYSGRISMLKEEKDVNYIRSGSKSLKLALIKECYDVDCYLTDDDIDVAAIEYSNTTFVYGC